MKHIYNYVFVSIAVFGYSSVYSMDHGDLQLRPDASEDLTQSSLWTISSIQAPDLYQQYGISSYPPVQWHLLADDTAQHFFDSLGRNIQLKPINQTVDLVATVASDIQQARPAHDEKTKQQSMLARFLTICLPELQLRVLDQPSVQKIEKTKSLPVLKYVFDALKKQNDESPLPISSRGYIVLLQKRIEVLERNGDYNVGQESRGLTISKRGGLSSSPQDIIAAAASVLGASLASSPVSSSPLDDSTSYDPSNSLLLSEEIQGAVNIYALLSKNVRELTNQITALDQMIDATDQVLNAPEVQDIPFTKRVLEELRQERKEQLLRAQVELESYQLDQNKAVESVAEVHKQLSERKEKREQALKKLEEDEKLTRSRMVMTQQFIVKAQKLQKQDQERLAALQQRREALEQAKKRVEPGIRTAQEFEQQRK